MSDQQENDQVARLGEINADLARSLNRCRFLLNECRSKLAANSNESERANDDDAAEETGLA